MNKTEYSLAELTTAGRRLLQACDDTEVGNAYRAHRSFGKWVDDVADWLDRHFPDSGQSARWSALGMSALVSGRHYSSSHLSWGQFHSVVQERLSWLGNSKILNRQNQSLPPNSPKTNDIFVVHGHDNEMKQEVARTLEQFGLNPIILHERPNRGQTIIEKFERESNVGFAVILLSSDDFGYAHNKGDESGRNRARQNVVLELGYFVGKLGRARVCALKKGDIEVPSDFAGVVYTSCDNGAEWRLALGQELVVAGYEVDLNKLLAR